MTEYIRNIADSMYHTIECVVRCDDSELYRGDVRHIPYYLLDAEVDGVDYDDDLVIRISGTEDMWLDDMLPQWADDDADRLRHDLRVANDDLTDLRGDNDWLRECNHDADKAIRSLNTYIEDAVSVLRMAKRRKERYGELDFDRLLDDLMFALDMPMCELD